MWLLLWKNLFLNSVFVVFCSHLCGPSEKDELCRRQTPALPITAGSPPPGPGHGRHPPGLRLSTARRHQGPPTPGRVPRILPEEPLRQPQEASPRRQSAGRHRQRDHLPQHGLTVTGELRPRQEESAVRENPAGTGRKFNVCVRDSVPDMNESRLISIFFQPNYFYEIWASWRQFGTPRGRGLWSLHKFLSQFWVSIYKTHGY